MAVTMGINLDEAFKIIHESNLTKLCNSKEEADTCIEHYKKTRKHPNPAYKQSKDGKYYIVYDKDTGKILKNRNYTRVDFKEFFERQKISNE